MEMTHRTAFLVYDSKAMIQFTAVGWRDLIPKTRHTLCFVIPHSHSTCSDQRHPDKDALRELISELQDEGMSYRSIGREIGLHWTRVGQIMKSFETDL